MSQKSGWMITFPINLLLHKKLLNSIVLGSSTPVIADNSLFHDALALTSVGEAPVILHQLGLTILPGFIPEPQDRPEFDPATIWLFEGTPDLVQKVMGDNER